MENFLIVGLGNYGKEYENTRHNIGFMFLDFIGINDYKKESNYMYSKAKIDDNIITFMKPLTYMNLSGEAISNFINYYKMPIENLMVIYDDIYIKFGTTRFRKKGSSGGHNGIKNIIKMLGTDEFKRIKIGVGNKPENWDLDDWVVSRFNESELSDLKNSFIETQNLVKEHIFS